MKTKTILIALIALIAIATMVFQSCKKDEEKTNLPPTCEITSPANGQEITKGEIVTISVDATDSDGNITEVRFFIDKIGKSSAISFPFNYNWNTSTESLGTHIIKSTAIDNDGGSTSDEITVTIVEGNGNTPVANFTGTPISGDAPLAVNFTDQSTNSPTSWQWDFGDGETSTQQNPTHTYNNNGTYIVTLTVTNNYGSDVETKTNYIVVSGGGGTGTFTDPRDGQTYNTVEIGSQEWFAENLNYVTSNSWEYDYSSTNGDIYGRLYAWGAALTACPSGWHLPSDDEWKQMEMALGMSQIEADNTGYRGTDEGCKMKETGTVHWSSQNTEATNSSGFTALPGGYRDTSGFFSVLGNRGYWWSATPNDSETAWNRYLRDINDKVYRGYANKVGIGYSVRCLRD